MGCFEVHDKSVASACQIGTRTPFTAIERSDASVGKSVCKSGSVSKLPALPYVGKRGRCVAIACENHMPLAVTTFLFMV
jgi:hypothetical protein